MMPGSALQMQRFRALRAALIGLVVLLGAMSFGMPFLAQSSKEAIERTTTHDIAWNGANGHKEIIALRTALLSYDQSEPLKRDRDIGIAIAIVQSRIETWRSGAFGSFIRGQPPLAMQMRLLEQRFRTISGLLADTRDAEARRTALFGLDEVMRSADRISSAAFVHNTREVAQNNRRLRNLQLAQQVSIGALLICAFLLLAILAWQNRLLRRAHAAEQAIARNNSYLAAHDALTGLCNRARFSMTLDQRCQFGQPFAIIMLDLDGFKPINDVLGHATGDALLVSVARRLEQFAAQIPDTVVARFGGDEFVLLLADVNSALDALSAAERLIAAIQAPHPLERHEVQVSASAGVALCQWARNTEDLVAKADLALAAAKTNGRGCAKLFLEDMMRSAIARAALEADLNGSDTWSEFEPNYQPIVDLASGEVIGCEALARWSHPVRGCVSPAEFIPIAEQSGRIIEIGEVMLMKACLAAMEMPQPIIVSVNVSAAQLLRINLPDLVARCLVRSGLPSTRLKLEITESVMIGDRARILRLIHELRDLGVAVSLDDFGTGYSSLSYLKDLPFDELKIDGSFVASIEHDRQACAVVQTIIALAANLDLRVVAEGIETEEQATLLRAMGCTRGQGYLFGRPVSAARLVEQLSPAPLRLIA